MIFLQEMNITLETPPADGWKRKPFTPLFLQFGRPSVGNLCSLLIRLVVQVTEERLQSFG